MDEHKQDQNNTNDDNQFSDYEELLNGFSSQTPEKGVGGHDSEDGFVLSELLDGVDAQDDEKSKTAGGIEGLNLDELGELNFDDITFDDDEMEPGVPDDTKKTTSGKFEIDIDDDNADYASILSELERGGAKQPADTGETESESSIEFDTGETDVIMDEDSTEGIELDLSGFGDSEDEIAAETEATDEARETTAEPDILPEPTGEMAESEAVDGEPVQSFGDLDTTEETSEKMVIDITSDESEQPDTMDEITGDLDAIAEDEMLAEDAETETVIADEEPPESVFDDDLGYASLIEESEEDETVSSADADEEDKPDKEVTGEYDVVAEEPEEEAFSPDVSYTSYIAAEDAAGVGETEPDTELAIADDTVDEQTGELEVTAGHEPVTDDASLSYADFIDDGQTPESDAGMEEPSFDLTGMSGETTDEHTGSFDQLEQEDFSLDETDLDLAFDDNELTSDTDSGSADEGIVVSGGDLEEETAAEDDFLGVSEPSDFRDDSFLGVADVKQEALPEIMLDGIEMNTVEQAAAVTRAELLIAQKRSVEAAAIYEEIASENGVSPFVARRIRELGVAVASPGQDAGELVE